MLAFGFCNMSLLRRDVSAQIPRSERIIARQDSSYGSRRDCCGGDRFDTTRSRFLADLYDCIAIQVLDYWESGFALLVDCRFLVTAESMVTMLCEF